MNDCQHNFDGKTVTDYADGAFMGAPSFNQQIGDGKQHPICSKCGLSKGMHDYLRPVYAEGHFKPKRD